MRLPARDTVKFIVWDYFTRADADLTNRDIVSGGTNFLRNKRATQELRVATDPDRPVSMVAGAYYYGSTAQQTSRSVYGPDAAAYLSGLPLAQLVALATRVPSLAGVLALNNTQSDIHTTPEIDSYALFGQAVWHITPALNLTGGARETYERETMGVWWPNPVSTITGAPVAALASQVYPETRVDVDDWSTSWLGSVDYEFAPAVRGYAPISHGAKAAGINSTVPTALGPQSLIVKPETATNYELGLKSRFLGNRVQANLSLFNMNIEDYQANFITTVPGTTTSVSIITNIGKVRSRGIEWDLSAAPLRGLTLALNGSYNEAEYRSYPAGPCPVEVTGRVSCDLSGKPVPQAPRWIVNASFNYRTDLGGGVTGMIGGNPEVKSSDH